MDSLVATTFCIGVVASHHSGIGGGGFAVVRDENGEYEVIDFRETAPAAASEDMYDGNVEGSVTSGLSVGVPGEVRGLEYMHKKYGVRVSSLHSASLAFSQDPSMRRLTLPRVETVVGVFT